MNTYKSMFNRCRICLDAGDIPIFGNEITTDPDISADVEVIGDIEIKIDDGFPKSLCRVCHQMLQAAILFRKIAQKSDRFLKYTRYKTVENVSVDSLETFIGKNVKKDSYSDINYYKIEDVNTNFDAMSSASENNDSIDRSENETSDCEKNKDSNEEMMLIIVSDVEKDEIVLMNTNSENSDNISIGNECVEENKKYSCKNSDLKKQCQICKNMYSKYYYDFHIATHNKSLRNYICEKCGKSFIQPTAFKIHSLTHSTDLPYKCQFCPYRGSHLGLLKVHVRTHTGDYPYNCTICDSRFITKSNLNMHLQRHKGPIDFKCSACNKGFYTKPQLEKHHKVYHLKIKEHVCDICGKAFGFKSNLLSHQVKIHNREKKIEAGQGRIPTYKLIEEGTVL